MLSALAGAAKLRAIPAADRQFLYSTITYITRVVSLVDPRRLFPNDPRPFQLQSADTHTRPYTVYLKFNEQSLH